jgi:electron transport complex protein RnfC
LFDECGGFKHKPARIVVGGSMSGYVSVGNNSAISKNVHTLLALNKNEVEASYTTECSHCYNCVGNCPKKLIPHEMYKAMVLGRYDIVQKMFVHECIGCGLCSYYCLARFSMTEAFKIANKVITKQTL